MIAGVMIISFFFGRVESTNTQVNNQTPIDTTALDELYTREYEDKLLYVADIISCKNDNFVIRKIVNSSGFGNYQVIVKLNSGNYEIVNLNENTTHLYILGDNKNPYIEFEFNSGSPSSIKKSSLYLPSSYIIETLTKNDSIVNDSIISNEEIKK